MIKLNKKGFTLVELLAVIVVLALLMVVATSSIGTALKNAKKNTLKTEAQKIISQIYQDAQSEYMLKGSLTSTSKTGTDGDYTYKVTLNSIGNVTEFCVRYKSELSITEKYAASGTGATVVTDIATSPAAPKISTATNVVDSGLCSVT